jgi:hypothetical protein
MFSKDDLLDAITECEKEPKNYHDCEKLATFYTIFDHLYQHTEPIIREKKMSVIDDYGNSDFFQKIKGKEPEEVWRLIDELLEALQVYNPNLYRSFMNKL